MGQSSLDGLCTTRYFQPKIKVEHPADVLCDRCPSGRAILATLAHNCTHCTVGRWSQGRKSVRTKQTSQIRLSVHPDPHQYLVTYDFQGGLTLQSITTAKCQLMQLTTMNERYLNQAGPKRCLTIAVIYISAIVVLIISRGRWAMSPEADSRLTCCD